MPKSTVPQKAVILVGGEGTRLRPLTNGIPKPMMPVLNRPFLEHTIAYLKQNGIDFTILALSYLPEVIQAHFGDGSRLGVELAYAVEHSPLGTAGAVKNAERYLDSTFVVLNGDIFTNLDLAEMFAFHRRKGAKATIALTHVDNPCAFGVVETDDTGRVRRFVEKPKPDEAPSNWINAGIYILEPEILEYVPQNRHYMFENGLFPHLLELGEPVYGYRFHGYWLDMGTPEKYLCLNCDLLSRKEKSALISGLSQDEVRCDGDVIIHPSAQIEGPAIIASQCQIGQRVRIKGPVVMGPGCFIADEVSLEEVVLWRGVSIGAGATLKQCVIGDAAEVEAGAQLINRVLPPRLS